jgi:hypothetical protein
VFSPSKRRYRKNPLIVDQSERLREMLGIRGPHSSAAVPPPGASVRHRPVQRAPVNHVARVSLFGLLARRAALFVVAYAPLAVLFLAATWPTGWTAGELMPLAAWLAALATVLAFPLNASFVPSGRPRLVVAAVTIASAGYVAAGARFDLAAPLTANPPAPATSALVAGVAFCVCVVAAELVALMVLTARRSSATSWRIRNAGEAGGLAFDYAFTYVFPIWVLWVGHADSAWVGPALTLYLLIVFAAFVSSKKFVLVNPVLKLLGFRLYDVVLQEAEGIPRHVVLISRNALAHHGHVKTVALGGDCFVGRRAAAYTA